MELAKSFDPAAIESRWYAEWEQRGYFAAGLDAGKPAFCIQLPPPNVTGLLHMGHAFNQTIMDALTRYHRMRGFNTLWLPGTDHAGIATQIVVERQLEGQGTSREALGREKFVEQVWAWKEQSGSTITAQMRRLGASCDWRREYFTMDPKLSRVVTETFVRLYEQGLIYRGKRLVNWDPVLLTAVSDLEVESEEEDGSLWHITYPFAGGPIGGLRGLTVATTRPETMLGDVAVAVNPEDERYKHLIGKRVVLPLADREIPVIGDAYVDKEFGTGCLKITPAHDFNDYQVAQRHGLPQIGDPHARREDQRQRAGEVSGARPLRRPQANRRRPEGARPAGVGQAAPDDGPALRPHRRGRRADAHRPVVRRDVQARARGHALPRAVDRRRRARRRDRRPGEVLPRELGQHLQPVAHEHPGLVHLAPALVGPPDPGLVRRRRPDLRRARRGRRGRAGARGGIHVARSGATPTSSTRGSPRPSSATRRSGGPSPRATTARRTSSIFRRRCSSPATRSSSSGSRG